MKINSKLFGWWKYFSQKMFEIYFASPQKVCFSIFLRISIVGSDIHWSVVMVGVKLEERWLSLDTGEAGSGSGGRRIEEACWPVSLSVVSSEKIANYFYQEWNGTLINRYNPVMFFGSKWYHFECIIAFWTKICVKAIKKSCTIPLAPQVGPYRVAKIY